MKSVENEWEQTAMKMQLCSRRCEKQQRNDRNNSEPWRSGIALRLKPPDALPSGWDNCSANTATNGLGTRNKELSYFLCTKAGEEDHLRSQLKRPTSPRIITGKQSTQQTYVDVAYCTVNTFIHKHPKSPHCPLCMVLILFESLSFGCT